MAALQRGIPGYAEGDSDTGGFGQLLRGYGQAITNILPGMTSQPVTGFAQARDNPASSPLTSTLGQFADYVTRNIRAQNAAAVGPTGLEWTKNLFAGDRDSTKALQDRATASQQLSDPLVQQYLTTNPDQLSIAERDPRGYGAVSTDPNFRAKMALAVGAHEDAAANDRVTQAEHAAVVKGAVDNDATAAQSHAALAPHKYTKDEFVQLFTGMPMKQLALLFGQQMGHVATPQEKASAEIFDTLHGNFAKANEKVEKMEAEIAEATKNKQTSPHMQAPWFGTSPYDAAKAERDKAYTATMDALKAFTGITGRPYPIVGQPGG